MLGAAGPVQVAACSQVALPGRVLGARDLLRGWNKEKDSAPECSSGSVSGRCKGDSAKGSVGLLSSPIILCLCITDFAC